ncbi:hypothetical protein FNYG_02214 [Fusarium nygamai]|uniref:Uncharacterized protein n=1 Tax=Gibberella nygamai TaxID=42673 RepID=A0A2K0WQM4_GIBNY|nr:hypothetical protein FNYG_02214 [Fusarium nygamai]
MDRIIYKFSFLLSKIFFDPMSLLSRLTQSQSILSLDAHNIQAKTMEDNQEPLLTAGMAVGAVTVEAPVDEPKKGRVLVLNGLPGTGKTSIVKNLKERLPGQKIQIVDSPIMAGPFCAHAYQREYRSAYVHETTLALVFLLFFYVGGLESGHFTIPGSVLWHTVDTTHKHICWISDHT